MTTHDSQENAEGSTKNDQSNFIVLVTGFGANLNAPYGNATSNPASLVMGLLPSSLPADHNLNVWGRQITILDSVAAGYAAIPGEYAAIRKSIRELHAKYAGKVDIVVHLGRSGLSFVTVERRAFRQDMTSAWITEREHNGYYLGPDNAGQNVRDLGPCPWEKVPAGLNTAFDVDVVVNGANTGLKRYYDQPEARTHHAGSAKEHGPSQNDRQKRLDVVPHFEAGPAGCGFAFYESMANCFEQGRKRDVLFCHVPRDTDQESIAAARDAILSIIGAAVDELIHRQEPQDIKMALGLVKD